MRIVLAMALALVPLMSAFPAASAGTPVDLDICDPLDCLIAQPPRCVNSYYASACAYAAYGCVTVMVDGHRQPITVSSVVPAQSVWTPPVNAGPVHVSSTHIWTDPIPVGPYTVYTLDNGASNTLCYWQYLEALALA